MQYDRARRAGGRIETQRRYSVKHEITLLKQTKFVGTFGVLKKTSSQYIAGGSLSKLRGAYFNFDDLIQEFRLGRCRI